MSFCAKCGTQVADGSQFCPSCGAPVGNAAPNQGVQNQQGVQYQQTAQYQQAATNTPVNNAPMNSYNNGYANQAPISDAEANKAMGILAYLSWLVLIPIFAAPQSKFARYHANQGLVLAIVSTAYGIVQGILTIILQAIFPYKYGLFSVSRGGVYTFLVAILGLVWILFSVLAVLGIINAVNGKEKELPVIGKIQILK